MAARTVRLFQDQNAIDHVNEAGTMSGKTDFTGQRKSKVGGRKPLGDLSNSVKPMNSVDGKKALNGSLNTSKLLKSKNNPTIILNKDVVSAKEKTIDMDKRTGSIVSKKSSKTGSRRALTDISNSEKLHVPDIKNKNSLKTSSLKAKYLDPDAIAEERMLHNHQECIKSQTQALDMHQFLKTVGLEDGSDDDMEIFFEPLKLKSESASLELKEVPEELPAVQSLYAEHGSPAHCKSPIFSSSTIWDDLDVNFNLKASP